MGMQLKNLLGLSIRLGSQWKRVGVRSLHGPPKVNEYVEVAQYPAIKPFKSQAEKDTAKAKQMVKDLKTVEEKMYQINRPKMYGWYTYKVSPDYISADFKDWSKFATCTDTIEGLPDQLQYNEDKDKLVDDVIAAVGGEIEQAIEGEQYVEYQYDVTNDRIQYREPGVRGKHVLRQDYIDNRRSEYLIKRIHHIIQSHLALQVDHVRDSVEDVDARVEGFWFRGGIQPDKSMIKKREGLQRKVRNRIMKAEYYGSSLLTPIEDEYVYAPYERAIQIEHKTVLQTRYMDPLDEFVDRDSDVCTNINIPQLDHDPRSYGVTTKCQHGTNIPGFWPQDNNSMGLLAFHSRKNGWDYHRIGSEFENVEEVERDQDISKGILTNFAWTLGQAAWLGFSPLTELTFPLASQSVNTDGRLWSYFAYQLNTCDLSSNDNSSHTHQNLLWHHPTEQLYNKIEDGKVVDFNPDCLRPLIKMYLNKPKVRNYSMTPYLDSEVPLVTKHADKYQREEFLKIIRGQTAKKKQLLYRKPEIFAWEKIKLIDSNVMAWMGVERRRRWWHMRKMDPLGKEHWDPEFISTDEKTDRYIPKGMRPEWTRKGKLNRRYNKFNPRIQVPLKDKIARYSLPDMKYNGDED